MISAEQISSAKKSKQKLEAWEPNKDIELYRSRREFPFSLQMYSTGWDAYAGCYVSVDMLVFSISRPSGRLGL